MPTSPTLSHRAARSAVRLILVASLALTAALMLPAPAMAETRGSDVVCSQTADERGLAAEDLPDISARNAIVVRSDGEVYFERDADAQVKIASTTKVMTAIVALEHASLDTVITVDHAAATVGESTAHLREGDALTLGTALKALLMPSGNDAAMAIARSIGAIIDPASADPYATFIQAMNDKAAELGMGAVFTNPHGLDFGAWENDAMHASARDVATMFAYAMQNDDFREISASTDNVITVTGSDGTERQIELLERNEILGQQGNIGGKTGGTYEALSCFVGAFSRDGDEIYTVVLGCEDSDIRWADTLALANWYYAHMHTAPVLNSERTTAEGELLVARASADDWTDKTIDVVADDPEATVRFFDLEGELALDVELETFGGDVERGAEAGTLTLTQGDETLATIGLVTAESIQAPSLLEWGLIQLDRFVRLFTGEPATAPSEIFATVPEV